MPSELRATVDPESDTVEIVVEKNGTEYEHIEADMDILVQNQQFVTSFERPILTLLTLYQREQQADLDEIVDTDLEDLPTQ